MPDMSSADTLTAVEAASETFKSWQYTTAKERYNLLRGWFNLCVQNGEELARLLITEARGEIGYGNSFLEWFSEEARRINGEIAGSPTNTKEMLFIRQPNSNIPIPIFIRTVHIMPIDIEYL